MSPDAALEMKDLKGPQVCLILGLALILAGSAVGLAALGKDVVTIFTGVGAAIIAVGVAFGWAKVQQLTRGLHQVNENVDTVKEISNGRLTELLEQNRQLHIQNAELSRLLPPPEHK